MHVNFHNNISWSHFPMLVCWPWPRIDTDGTRWSSSPSRLTTPCASWSCPRKNDPLGRCGMLNRFLFIFGGKNSGLCSLQLIFLSPLWLYWTLEVTFYSYLPQKASFLVGSRPVFFNLNSANSLLGSLKMLYGAFRFRQMIRNFRKVLRLEKGWKPLL